MIKNSNLQELVKSYKYFILATDGVIWENEKEIGDSVKALKYLFENKKSVFILANDSYNSRADLAKKGKTILGVDIPNCWYNTSWTTAMFLKNKFPEVKSVYVVGGPGIVDELALVGIENVSGLADSAKKYNEKTFWNYDFKDKKMDCVIVGLDPGLNYYKLVYATNSIKKGAKFIATDFDIGVKMGKFLMPGAGSLVHSIAICSETKPILIGKPEATSLEMIMKECKIPADEKDKIIVIGDNLETDMKFARNTGTKLCIVLTGKTTEEMLKGDLKPDYVMEKLGTF